MKSPAWRAATSCQGARLPVPLHKGTPSKEHIFRCARVCLGNVLDRPLILRGGSRALVAAIAQARVPCATGPRSCVHTFQQIGASSLHTKRTRLQHAAWARIPANVNSVHNQSEYAAWDSDTPGSRVRLHLVRNLLRCRRAYPGGAVDLRWIRVRDRLLAALGASRTVSGPAGNSRRSPRLPQPLISATLWPELESDLRGFGSREPVRWILRVRDVPVRYA